MSKNCIDTNEPLNLDLMSRKIANLPTKDITEWISGYAMSCAITEALLRDNYTYLDFWTQQTVDWSLFKDRISRNVYYQSDVKAESLIRFLEYSKKHDLPLFVSSFLVEELSEYGQLSVLNKLTELYSSSLKSADARAAYYASCYGHVEVLDWLKTNMQPFKYGRDAIDCASERGHIAVLQWWKDSGLPLKYTQSAFNHITDPEVIDWWATSGLEMKFSRAILSNKRNVGEVLDRMAFYNIPFKGKYGGKEFIFHIQKQFV